MKNNKEHMLFSDFASERAEIFGHFKTKQIRKMVKSMGKMKINKENMYFSDFASERAEIFFDILTIKLMGKMVKSMKIHNENMYIASERAEILWYFNH